MLEKLYQILMSSQTPEEAIKRVGDFINQHNTDWQKRALLLDTLKILLVIEHFKSRHKGGE